MVNKSLEVFHQQIPSDGGYGLPNHDSQRRSCRVRSMSWALPKEVGRSNIESNGLQDSSASSAVTQYLAVTDDADEVAILMITSPWLHRGSLAWKAQVRCKASWEELKMLWFSNREAAATEVDASAMTGAEEAHWPSIFVDSMRKKAFIDRVMCRPCQSHQADLGLILRRGGQTLNFEVSLDVISNLSTINGRTPISFANKASPSSLYSPFFECGCATFPKKALKSSESNSGCIDTPNARTSLYVAVANAGAVEVYCFKSRKGSVEDAGTRTNDNDGSCTLVLTDGWDKISGDFQDLQYCLKRTNLNIV